MIMQGKARNNMDEDIKIDKHERRKRLIEDFKKIFENNVDAIKFAENLPDELLDKFEVPLEEKRWDMYPIEDNAMIRKIKSESRR